MSSLVKRWIDHWNFARVMDRLVVIYEMIDTLFQSVTGVLVVHETTVKRNFLSFASSSSS